MTSLQAYSILGVFFLCVCVICLIMCWGSSENSALQALKASDWQIEAAFDVFYSQPQPKSNGDLRRLEELFNRYKGNAIFSFSCVDQSHVLIIIMF